MSIDSPLQRVLGEDRFRGPREDLPLPLSDHVDGARRFSGANENMQSEIMAPARIARFLLDLARRSDATAPIDLQMSRRNMADGLDLSVEMVCRVLSQFAEAGFIAIPDPWQAEILDSAALEAIIDIDQA